MTRRWWVGGTLLTALCAAAALGAYSYYYTDALTSINTAYWWTNGSYTSGSGGFSNNDSTGASLISKVAVPDGTSEYEVKTTLTLLGPGGTYVTYLRASSNARSGPGATGTAYAMEVQNPTFNGSSCTATLAGYRIQSGSTTLLSSMQIPCRNGMEVRVVYRASINVFIDGLYYYWSGDTAIISGQPGIGVRGAPAGNAISSVSLGALDRVAPDAVDRTRIGTSSFPTQVDMQWKPPADNANGIGIAFYHVNRNGGYVDTYNRPEFSDRNVSPGTQYDYQIQTFERRPTAWTAIGKNRLKSTIARTTTTTFWVT